MALRTDKAVEVFTASALGQIKANEIELREANAAIQMLASHPTPDNRYEIGQIVAFTVEQIMTQSENWLQQIAETKSVAMGDKAMFKVEQNGIKAYIQAKGSTTPRSKVMNRYITVDTEEVSSRPYINYLEMAAGKVDMGRLSLLAAQEMESKKLGRIEKVLQASVKQWTTGKNYASGDTIVPATFNPLLQRINRLGKATILGDIEAVSRFNGISGYNGNATPSDRTQDEIMDNGFIGRYLGAKVAQYTNPLDEKGDPILAVNWLYILPNGLVSPLKIVNEGSVNGIDQTNIDDASYELCLRQNFGAAIVIGNYPTIASYEILAN